MIQKCKKKNDNATLKQKQNKLNMKIRSHAEKPENERVWQEAFKKAREEKR